MSAEGLGPEGRGGEVPKNPTSYPSVDQVRKLFAPQVPTEKSPSRKIGPLLKSLIEDQEFKGKDDPQKEVFYEGVNAGAEFMKTEIKSEPQKLRITSEVVEDYFFNKIMRRHFSKLTPEEDWLRQYDELASEEGEEVSGKIFDMALEKSSPSHFLGGVALVYDLRRTDEELRVFRSTPRKDASETFPLNVNDIEGTFDEFYANDYLLLEEIKNMRRENIDLYKKVQARYMDLSKVDFDRGMDFMYGAFGAYHLIGAESIEEGKLPAQVPDFLIEVPNVTNFEAICEKEIDLLEEIDPETSDLLADFLEEGKEDDYLLGLAEGFSMVARSFRLAKECRR